MNHKLLLAAILLPAVMLTGCETLGGLGGQGGDDVVVEDRGTQADGSQITAGDDATATATGATATGAQAGAVFQGHQLDNPQSILSSRIIYFEFDSAAIRNEDRAAIQAHAEYLGENGAAAVVLEGHSDERGSREYNIALAERRAKAVRQLLLFQGAIDAQIQTVSYGEESPAAIGHDESTWQQNRRVEIIYKTR